MLRSTIFTRTNWLGLGVFATESFIEAAFPDRDDFDSDFILDENIKKRLIDWTDNGKGINPTSLRSSYRKIFENLEPGDIIMITEWWWGHTERENDISGMIFNCLKKGKGKGRSNFRDNIVPEINKQIGVISEEYKKKCQKHDDNYNAGGTNEK